MCVPGVYLPCLYGFAIHGEIEEVGANAAVVEQRVAFARSTVADDSLALALGVDQEFEQLALGLLHLLAEVRVGLEPLRHRASPRAPAARAARSVTWLAVVLGVPTVDAQ